MTDKRLYLALASLALLAGCDRERAEEGAAQGEVLKGTISDAMLPLDSVQSEPPLEDPEAFAEVQSKAAADAPAGTEAGGASEDEAPDEEDGEAPEPAAPPAPEPAD